MGTIAITINVRVQDYKAVEAMLDKEQVTVKQFLRNILQDKIEGRPFEYKNGY